MDAIEHYRRLFRYDRWANREVLQALRTSAADADPVAATKQATGEPPPRTFKLLAHIVGAEWLWLARLSLPAEETGVWPELNFDQCERQIETLGQVWDGYVAGLDAERLEDSIEYTNSKGQPWRSRIEDVLTHVVMHSAYHRGQIAREMRAAALHPAYTDFIQAVRTGAVGD
ncbi:MAG TPA: DinB family protein [Terriglobia bacterium]|jgi:uncharacterized damage-inducible protein DinB|nr:DinB family protein [Terriglobia bacterium]